MHALTATVCVAGLSLHHNTLFLSAILLLSINLSWEYVNTFSNGCVNGNLFREIIYAKATEVSVLANETLDCTHVISADQLEADHPCLCCRVVRTGCSFRSGYLAYGRKYLDEITPRRECESDAIKRYTAWRNRPTWRCINITRKM